MKIDKLAQDDFMVELSPPELQGIYGCFLEACHGIKIEDFDKWFGTTREEVTGLLEFFKSVQQRHETSPYASPAGIIARLRHAESGSYRVEVNRSALETIHRCFYEVCNRIRLYEFQLRTGIELENALAMLREMTDFLKLLNPDWRASYVWMNRNS